MNLIAAFELVPVALLGTLVWWLSGRSDTHALFAAGTLLIATDLAVRWRQRASIGTPLGWLYGPRAGGVLLVFPVWLLGLVQLGVGLARILGIAV
jgi:hypothetical protein